MPPCEYIDGLHLTLPGAGGVVHSVLLPPLWSPAETRVTKRAGAGVEGCLTRPSVYTVTQAPEAAGLRATLQTLWRCRRGASVPTGYASHAEPSCLSAHSGICYPLLRLPPSSQEIGLTLRPGDAVPFGPVVGFISHAYYRCSQPKPTFHVRLAGRVAHQGHRGGGRGTRAHLTARLSMAGQDGQTGGGL